MASKNSTLHQRLHASLGFTLVELMVTIAVMAIVISMAAPNISSQIANQQVKSTTATLANALKEAKSESMIRRQDLTLSYDDSDDEKIITIENAGSEVIASYSYNKKSTISRSGSGDIIFEQGKVDNSVTYTICDENTSVTNRQVSVSKLATITTKTGGTCS